MNVENKCIRCDLRERGEPIGPCRPGDCDANPIELKQIGKLQIFEVCRLGKSIGTINAHKPDKIHAIDDRSRVHYDATIDACVEWLKGRAT